MASNDTHLTPPLDLVSVTIGVLTALEEEYAACLDVLDPDRADVEAHRRATSGPMTCWLCPVPARHGGHHVVAISLLPDMGNNAAAITANILLQHCPAISHLIMCGIAGAVPHPEKPEDHVRLGDIVVSSGTGVIQYDRGKQRDSRKPAPPAEDSAGKKSLAMRVLRWLLPWFVTGAPNSPDRPPLASDPLLGFDFRAPPRPPCPVLLQAVKRMHADEELLGRKDPRPWESKIDEFLKRVNRLSASPVLNICEFHSA